MTHISIIIPHPSRWQESKQLRLQALQNDPLAFGASYEEDVLLPDTSWEERLQSINDHKNQITLYAQADKKLIGMMGAFWSQRKKLRHIAHIYGVYIEPDYRGQGIGKQLMQALIDRLTDHPHISKMMLTVNMTQTPAQQLYKHFGFTTIGIAHHELMVDGQYYDELYMEKLL